MIIGYIILIVSILFSFLCGSIPTGYLVSRDIYGVDIRKKGSGNIGSTNVNRILGRRASLYTQLVDIIKGIIPVAMSIYVNNMIQLPVSKDLFLSITAIAVILGHDYTPFLNFKGGKGVNTTVGAFLFIATLPDLIGITAYFALRMATSIVSIRSLSIGLLLFLMCIVFGMPKEIICASAIAFILLILRHKDNLIRLVRHEEK